MKKIHVLILSVFVTAAVFLGAAPAVQAAEGFEDVPDAAWFCREVDYVSEKGFMTGTEEGKFSPRENLSRAMFVTILHRLAGSPEAAQESAFLDVPADSYYKEALDWAFESGIVLGTSETTFSPSRDITRQEIACMIARYVEGIGAELRSDFGAFVSFGDEASVSAYAKDAVKLMKTAGVLRGNADGNFYPRSNATRAEAAAICMRLALKLNMEPDRAVVQAYDEVAGRYAGNPVVLSEEDTEALSQLLNNPEWEVTDLYAAYVPTHTVYLNGAEYYFEFLDELEISYDHVNYVHGENYDIYEAISAPAGELLPGVRAIFDKYGIQ